MEAATDVAFSTFLASGSHQKEMRKKIPPDCDGCEKH